MTWELKGYNVYEETDVLRFEDTEGNVIGYVAFNENKEEMLEELENGVDPILENWEDGIGNTLTITGWGNEEPKNLEEMYERLEGLLKTDGENEKYMTYYENKEDVIDEIDEEMFKEKFGVELDNLNYPIVTIDEPMSTLALIFDEDNYDVLRDEALYYFDFK